MRRTLHPIRGVLQATHSARFRAGQLSSLQVLNSAGPLANNFQKYTNLLGSGVTFWAVNPHALDDPMAYWKSLYPDTTTQASPETSWAVWQKELSSYLQADFNGDLGSMRYSGNVGVRFIHTNLDITQYLSGLPGPNITEPASAGTQTFQRSYNDVLPAINLALNITNQFTMRLSYSKNMMPLNLSQWGGGLQLNYSLQETKTGPIYQVATGSSNGNPNLDPWRSSNYGASFEYYINSTSLVNLELFHINVQSFIKNGAVINCSLPDADGVVRNHCISIIEPLQGSGNSIQGAEFDYRQGFTFLPGFLSYTGMEFNFTYAPSNTGERDLAGNKIPFQDNSTESGNFILWYQDKHFQARVAYNYRSKRAFQDSVGGITGLEEYEAPQHVPRRIDRVQVQQVPRSVRGRHEPHQRVPALLPGMDGPIRALELRRTHVHLRRPRTVVISGLHHAGGAGGAGVHVARWRRKRLRPHAGEWRCRVRNCHSPLADSIERQGAAKRRRSLLCRVFNRRLVPGERPRDGDGGAAGEWHVQERVLQRQPACGRGARFQRQFVRDSLVVPHRVHRSKQGGQHARCCGSTA